MVTLRPGKIFHATSPNCYVGNFSICPRKSESSEKSTDSGYGRVYDHFGHDELQQLTIACSRSFVLVSYDP